MGETDTKHTVIYSIRVKKCRLQIHCGYISTNHTHIGKEKKNIFVLFHNTDNAKQFFPHQMSMCF